ncbi:MAG: amidase [Candidatus Marinimicrobia bacterium]|jgi:Asp-tRNA(Asn)/Glu-tRNA(Gln) amidotransferase A subunit family amidase|nr:amidase [Candidatus Neomarinimicrobiota bacterium]
MRKIYIIKYFMILLFLFSCRTEIENTNRDAIGMENLIGISLTQDERDTLLTGLLLNKNKYDTLRMLELTNDVPLPLYFNPLIKGESIPKGNDKYLFEEFPIKKPSKIEDCAFYTIGQLAYLIRTRQITSEELTRMYIERLKEYGPQLECVITVTEELGIKQARKADEEIKNGRYLGPLHGIPYGAKDLLAVSGYKTTWGANTHKDQIINETATVIKKLENSGAVLIAKLTLGALAWGDIWYGGKTRNPWDIEKGSSGSSAGPGSATAAGLVAFSIGSETWGSIISPSSVNGVTGLRPSFGTISKSGAMALSWSMDKLGPMCRSVDDCALVYNAIKGPDKIDHSVVDVPFQVPNKKELTSLRVGYIKSAFENEKTTLNDKNVLLKLKELGFDLIPIELPEFPTNSLSFLLNVEAAAAFDELTRNNTDALLTRQIKWAWPNIFRQARHVPAVEYIQANRARVLLNQKMADLFLNIDVYVAPSFWKDNLLRTNLTGHPCVVLPNGFNEEGLPTSISFIGNLYKDGQVIAVSQAYQRKTDWHKKYPPGFAIQ